MNPLVRQARLADRLRDQAPVPLTTEEVVRLGLHDTPAVEAYDMAARLGDLLPPRVGGALRRGGRHRRRQ